MSGSIPTLPRPFPLDSIQRALRDLRQAVSDNAPARIRVGDPVSKTGQVANLTTTNVITAAKNGIYRVIVVLQCTTGDATAGMLTLTLGWTDRAGAATDAVLTRVLTATGRNSRSYELQVQGDTHITYAVAVTGIYATAAYAVEIKLERIAD